MTALQTLIRSPFRAAPHMYPDSNILFLEGSEALQVELLQVLLKLSRVHIQRDRLAPISSSHLGIPQILLQALQLPLQCSQVGLPRSNHSLGFSNALLELLQPLGKPLVSWHVWRRQIHAQCSTRWDSTPETLQIRHACIQSTRRGEQKKRRRSRSRSQLSRRNDTRHGHVTQRSVCTLSKQKHLDRHHRVDISRNVTHPPATANTIRQPRMPRNQVYPCANCQLALTVRQAEHVPSRCPGQGRARSCPRDP
jgi:hypothetical protein